MSLPHIAVLQCASRRHGMHGFKSEACGSRRTNQPSQVRVRLTLKRKASTKTNFGVSFPLAHRRRRGKPLLPADAISLSKCGTQPSFWPADYIQETTTLKDSDRPAHTEKKEVKLQKPLTYRPCFEISACRSHSFFFQFSHNTPHSHSFMSQPVQGDVPDIGMACMINALIAHSQALTTRSPRWPGTEAATVAVDTLRTRFLEAVAGLPVPLDSLLRSALIKHSSTRSPA